MNLVLFDSLEFFDDFFLEINFMLFIHKSIVMDDSLIVSRSRLAP